MSSPPRKVNCDDCEGPPPRRRPVDLTQEPSTAELTEIKINLQKSLKSLQVENRKGAAGSKGRRLVTSLTMLVQRHFLSLSKASM